jgi:hypothetical protein
LRSCNKYFFKLLYNKYNFYYLLIPMRLKILTRYTFSHCWISIERPSHNNSVPTGGAAYASSIPALPLEPAYLLNPTAAAPILATMAVLWMRAQARRCRRDLRAAAPPTVPHHPLPHFPAMDRALPPKPHVAAAASWIGSSPPPPVPAVAPWMPHPRRRSPNAGDRCLLPSISIANFRKYQEVALTAATHMQVALPTIADLRPLLPVPISSSRCRKADVGEIGHCRGGVCQC